MMMLIVGANGFIGKSIIDLLNKRNMKYEIFNGDIVSKESILKYVDKYDVVLHLASIISHIGKDDIKTMDIVNIQGTVNLLQHFKTARFVYISTTDVERICLSNYAKTKMKAEQIVLKNKKNLVIRLPSIFGNNTRQRKLIPLLINKYRDDIKFEINNNEEREYLYVERCATLIIDNIDREGILTLKGIKIFNLELESMIKDIIDKNKLTKYKQFDPLCLDLNNMINGVNT